MRYRDCDTLSPSLEEITFSTHSIDIRTNNYVNLTSNNCPLQTEQLALSYGGRRRPFPLALTAVLLPVIDDWLISVTSFLSCILSIPFQTKRRKCQLQTSVEFRIEMQLRFSLLLATT